MIVDTENVKLTTGRTETLHTRRFVGSYRPPPSEFGVFCDFDTFCKISFVAEILYLVVRGRVNGLIRRRLWLRQCSGSAHLIEVVGREL